MSVQNSQRNRLILALYGQKSFGVIAKELGISRNIVAGVVFRHNRPPGKRVKVGGGYHGGGQYAQETLPRNLWAYA